MMSTETLSEILEEYPIYLRWGQLVALHKRLGLGSEWTIKRRVLGDAPTIRRRLIGGKRHYYIREDVERIARGCLTADEG